MLFHILLPSLVLFEIGVQHVLTKNVPTPSNGCDFGGIKRMDGEHWVHQSFFNVTCNNGKIQVLNCITEKGTQIALGTAKHVENGFSYNCKLHFGGERTRLPSAMEREGGEQAARTAAGHSQPPSLSANANYDDSGVGIIPPASITNSTTSSIRHHSSLSSFPSSSSHHVPECDYLPGTGRAEYVRAGYAVSCVSNEIIGCVDGYGDLVRSGQHFVLPRGLLRRCVVYAQGRWAKMEHKGCFNGTKEDDPADARFHVPKGGTWRSGADFELRCGEEGIHVHKCLVDGQRIHVGTGWIDRENVLNICQ